MAIIKCENCGNSVSDKATQCPHCNITIREAYSNPVAKSFKNWSNRVQILGILILIIMIIGSLVIQNIYVFWSSLCVYGVFVASSLFLSAIAEIIQKLQNIEENTRK